MKAFAVTEAARLLPYCSRDPCLRTLFIQNNCHFERSEPQVSAVEKSQPQLSLPLLRTSEAFHSTTDTRCAYRSEMSERLCQRANGAQAVRFIYCTHSEKVARVARRKGRKMLSCACAPYDRSGEISTTALPQGNSSRAARRAHH